MMARVFFERSLERFDGGSRRRESTLSGVGAGLLSFLSEREHFVQTFQHR